MNLRSIFFIVISFFVFQQTFAQRNYKGYNRFGVQGGMTLFDINTDDLITKQSEGFAGGFTTRGAFYNDFDIVYGLSFYNSNIDIQTDLPTGGTQFIDYTIQAAQLSFLGSYNIIVKHLSVEFGPVLNVNSKMKLNNDQYEDYIISGYNSITAKDIQKISPVNFHVAGGLTAGFESFRVSALYQYGVTNTLNKLNDQDLENEDFKGNSSTITLGAVFYF